MAITKYRLEIGTRKFDLDTLHECMLRVNSCHETKNIKEATIFHEILRAMNKASDRTRNTLKDITIPNIQSLTRIAEKQNNIAAAVYVVEDANGCSTAFWAVDAPNSLKNAIVYAIGNNGTLTERVLDEIKVQVPAEVKALLTAASDVQGASVDTIVNEAIKKYLGVGGNA